MKNTFCLLSIVASLAGMFTACAQQNSGTVLKPILLKNATLIDGRGGAPVAHTDILLQGDTIAGIGHDLPSSGRAVVDATGKTIMPALISTHVHIGTLKGTGSAIENYTRENILSQLRKYQDYGVLNLLVMGTDRPLLFANGFYDSLKTGLVAGARLYSAGHGFGVPGGAPGAGGTMDLLYRPAAAANVPAEMDSLAALKPAVVKMWVDDFGGQFKKMDTAVYGAIICEAHKHGLRAAAHLWYLSDARRLVADGLDIIAHSIRDSVIDDALVAEMKAKNVRYIPTLSLDEFAYVYAERPAWMDDAFFKASLEPGVYEMINSPKYQQELKNSPGYARSRAGFEVALKNLLKLYKAGVLVSLGTDSGALPVRAQGFSEHQELELMVQAGLTPLDAITVATRNAAVLLGIDNRFGIIEKGKVADLLILNGDPSLDIKNTRKIAAVYKSGQLVSAGPIK